MVACEPVAAVPDKVVGALSEADAAELVAAAADTIACGGRGDLCGEAEAEAGLVAMLSAWACRTRLWSSARASGSSL